MNPTAATLADAHAMRHADADWLSLALMAARNQTLAWLACFEAAAAREPTQRDAFAAALQLAGHLAWRQERWIARNLQRRGRQGARDDPGAASAPLASIEPQADAWWSQVHAAQRNAAGSAAPDAASTRAYAAETLEATLELLHTAARDDAGLHLFRAALFDEDGRLRHFVAMAQAHRIEAAARLVPERRRLAAREPLRFGAQAWPLGSPRSGFVPANEQWAHEVAVPAFEIDAQPVGWAAYAEFVADGGYDESAWWSDAGQAWLQGSQRRSPRDVEQIREGVLLRRFGRLQRAAGIEPASGLSAHEAEAWCRWAGRRLPTEVEWELAASRGAGQGFAWGDVAEWVGGSARAWPGAQAAAAFDDRAQQPGGRVQRGVAWFEPRRLAHPQARRFVPAAFDAGFAGFRSCAL